MQHTAGRSSAIHEGTFYTLVPDPSTPRPKIARRVQELRPNSLPPNIPGQNMLTDFHIIVVIRDSYDLAFTSSTKISDFRLSGIWEHDKLATNHQDLSTVQTREADCSNGVFVPL